MGFAKLVVQGGSFILFFLKPMIFIFKIPVKFFLFYFIFLHMIEKLKIFPILINHF